MNDILHNKKRFLLLIICIACCALNFSAKAQCPQFFNRNGIASSSPTWLQCIVGASPATTTLTIQAASLVGPCTIDWGDGSGLQVVAAILPNGSVSHVYTFALGTKTVTITQTLPIPCVIVGHYVVEREVRASIIAAAGGVTTVCAPGSISFLNNSQDVSDSTTFTLDFGDNTPVLNLTSANAGQIINHTYLKNSVNCNTNVTLTARNLCSGNAASTNIYGPIRIFDIDSAIIGASKNVLCYPDTNVIFTNSSVRNCVNDGNTQQRLERWIIHDYFGPGLDSVTNWSPWPPSTALNFNFPAPTRPRTYCVTLMDSSFCGVDTATRCITIIDPPIASFTSVDTVCGSQNITFTNTTPTAGTFAHAWDFGDGNTSTQISPTHSFTNAGNTTLTFNVRLIVTNGGATACRDTFIKVITVLPRPTSNFSQNAVAGNINGCDSLMVNFVDLSTNAISWDWDFDNNGLTDFSGQFPPVRKYLITSTVRLTVTGANGCSHTRTRTISIFRTPLADFTASSVCVNKTATFTDGSTPFPGNAITTRSWNFGDPASGGNNTSTATNPTHVFTIPNTYFVRLIVNSANGCSDTIIKSVIVQFPPTVNFTPTVTTGCSPLSVTFTNNTLNADPTLYVWKRLNAGNFSTQVSPSVTYVNNGTTNDTIRVRLVASTAFGCLDSITKTIVVFPNPIAGFAANTLPSCIPSPISFVNTSSGAISFAWDFNDGNFSNLPNPIHQFNNNSNSIRVYQVRLVATSPNTCTDTAELPVLVYPNQTFVINTNVDTGCTPVHVQFPAFPGIVNYNWDFGDAQLGTGASPQHTYVNFTQSDITYTARAILTNAFGCIDTVFKNTVVKPIPTAFFTSNVSSGCLPFDVSFQNVSTSATQYHWDFGDSTSENTVSAIVNHRYRNETASPLKRTVTLTAYNNDSCESIHTQDVLIFPQVKAIFSIDSVACSPFVAQADNRSIAAQKYYWFLDGSLIDSVQNKEFIISNSNTIPETHVIRLRSISAFGCFHDTSFTVRVLPSPTANFITDVTSGCQPLSINFTNLSTSGIKYYWNYGDGNDSNINATFQRVYTNNSRLPIEYPVQLVVRNTSGCVDTFSRIITVYPFLDASFTLNDTASCSPFTIHPQNTSTNTINYAWYVDNVLIDTNANPTITLTNITFTNQTFQLRLEAGSAYGCIVPYTRTIQVFPRPEANFLVTNPVIKFPLNTFSLVNQNIQAGFNYKWFFGDGDSALIASPGTHTYFQPGNYEIILIVFNSQCSDTMRRMVRIEPPTPIAVFNGTGIGCAPLTVSFINQTLYATTYNWDFGDGNTSSEFEPTHTYKTGGVYSVRLVAIGDGGEDIEIHQDSVTVFDLPNAYFLAQPSIVYIPSDPLVIFNLSTNATRYHWDFGDGTQSIDPSPQHYYTTVGDYTIRLIAENENGCLDTFRVFNAVRAEGGGKVVVPNAFTPNLNGGSGGAINPNEFNNDVFHPVINGAEEYYLSIFNRWGELLFESRDVNTGWDGYYRNKLCKQDVYVWKVEAIFSDGSKITKSGDLLLLR